MSDERKPRKKAAVHGEAEKLTLGQCLARVRKEAGYTMDAAAKALGLSGKGAIDNFEKGRNVIDAIQLRQLARFYDASVDELVGVPQRQTSWPFSNDLHEKVIALPQDAIFRLEGVMRAHLDMPALTKTGIAELVPHAYPVRPEAGADALYEAEIPAPQRNAVPAKDRRPQRRKGGGRA